MDIRVIIWKKVEVGETKECGENPVPDRTKWKKTCHFVDGSRRMETEAFDPGVL